MSPYPHSPLLPDTRNLIHETIAVRAYEIWEKRGHPENEALDHWLQAEREFMSGRRPGRPHSPIHSTKHE